jgi:hypothetical protein
MSKENVKLPSNKKFGLFFSVIFLLASIYCYYTVSQLPKSFHVLFLFKDFKLFSSFLFACLFTLSLFVTIKKSHIFNNKFHFKSSMFVVIILLLNFLFFYKIYIINFIFLIIIFFFSVIFFFNFEFLNKVINKDNLIIFISFFLGLYFVEGAYRLYLYYTYSLKTEYFVSTIEEPLIMVDKFKKGNIFSPYLANATQTHSQYTMDGKSSRHWQVRYNNLGWVSHNDYNAKKDINEYRIAIIGDSMTASNTNDLPWPDITQEYLNQDK